LFVYLRTGSPILLLLLVTGRGNQEQAAVYLGTGSPPFLLLLLVTGRGIARRI
jgi:hypothetical protein